MPPIFGRLKTLTAPTLEIVPVPTHPAAYEGPDSATATSAERAKGYAAFYSGLFPGAANVRVVAIPDSLHFVMIDQPRALFDAISEFIAKL